MKSFESQVADWARTKPADEDYRYTSACNCALSQFLRETGFAKKPNVNPMEWCDMDGSAPAQMLPDGLDNKLRAEPWTFGALADRLSS